MRSLEGLKPALDDLGCPAIPKTAAFGYDGKGQFRIESDTPDSLAESWNAIGKHKLLEAFIDFDREISVVAARGADGQFVHYGAILNQHSRHILDVSIATGARIVAGRQGSRRSCALRARRIGSSGRSVR